MAWYSHLVSHVVRSAGVLGVFGAPMLRPNTIEGLPPFALRQAVEALLRTGWIKTFEYEKDDAWVDYARVDLLKGGSKLKLEWDQENGGSVAGPRAVLDDLRVLDPWTHLQMRHVPH
jgi:hypothetical protein